MLTDNRIDEAKIITLYTDEICHEHHDCIRIALAWFDAQKKTKGVNKTSMPEKIKHLIESWGGRYISEADVCVAACLHEDIKGSYPYFNISQSLVYPSLNRLICIGEANTHENYKPAPFSSREDCHIEYYSTKENSTD